MANGAQQWDVRKFIHPAQVGGIEAYTVDEGPGRGVRVLCVNTGAGLRYRVLADRGLDIDQAFCHQHSLSFLAAPGLNPPTRALDHGIDWLKGFTGGLLTSCGPFNIGSPATDAGEELGLHGSHSNTAASIESVVQPDLRAGRLEMSITGILRYGPMFGPNLELRRTLRSTLGENRIDITDEFFNYGNQVAPHAWLLHINFGYPLVDAGAEFCYDARTEPRNDPDSVAYFKTPGRYRRVPQPLASHQGRGEAVSYLYPRTAGRAGQATVAMVNPKLQLGVAIHYDTRQFPRCGNWHHFGPYEYVAALEPMNGTVEGRDKDRAGGLMDSVKPGQRKTYRYQIEVVTSRSSLSALRRLGHSSR